jgi:hypothetical protein
VTLQARLRQPALRVRGTEHDVAAVLMAGVASGAWPALLDRVASGVLLERDGDLPSETVRDHVRRLRRRLGLLSRADLRAWLAVRSLTADDLTGVARRAALRDGGPPGPVTWDDDLRTAVAERLWPELLCTQGLRSLAQPLVLGLVAERRLGDAPPATCGDVDAATGWALADRVSELGSLGEDELRERAERACALVDHGRRLVAEATGEAAVAARLRERRLAWRALVLEEVWLPHEGAAREACAQARLEGRELREVAAAHGFAHRRRRVLAGEADPEVRGQLLAAQEGDVIGPVRTEGEQPFLVVGVEEAEAVHDDDPELARRAAAELEHEAIALATTGAVTWVDPC